jgi:hypothetical protein
MGRGKVATTKGFCNENLDDMIECRAEDMSLMALFQSSHSGLSKIILEIKKFAEKLQGF